MVSNLRHFCLEEFVPRLTSLGTNALNKCIPHFTMYFVWWQALIAFSQPLSPMGAMAVAGRGGGQRRRRAGDGRAAGG